MYITYWNPPRFRQITFEEMLVGISDIDQVKIGDSTSTRTISVKNVPAKLLKITNVGSMVTQLKKFNERYEDLEKSDMNTHYHHFEIPKKTGGMRPIDAPDDELKEAQKRLLNILKSFMIADYHNCAYAYIPHRSTVSCVYQHKVGHTYTIKNPETGDNETKVFENNWAVKFDFHGFFPSTTPEFVIKMFKQIYPFELIMRSETGAVELQKALKICFKDGGLPQGSCISPWLTNVMMIPFDHLLSRKLDGYKMNNGNECKFTYTRYADDITISCYLAFDPMEIQSVIINLLNFIGAPFGLNEIKTHYGNRNSSKNWILGLQWNSDNKITVGWKNMKVFKAMCYNYCYCKSHGRNWDLEDVQRFNGKISYYRMIEKDIVNEIISKYNNKFGIDIENSIKEDMKG